MAFATKYRFSFKATNGLDYSILIEKDGYNGQIKDRALGRAPVLKKEQNGPIHGTSLEFYAECLVDQEFSELYTSSAKEWRVRLLIGTSTVWTGFVSPELYSEPAIAPPYDVDIIATDGIGELKMYDFAGQGETSLDDLITYLLGYTAVGTTHQFVSSMRATDPPVAKSDFLSDISINADFMSGDTCYDVLTYILNSLHATITWYRDKWWIVRETNAAAAGGIQTATLNSDGWWPIGNLSTKVEAAKNRITVKTPWYFVEGGFRSINMEDSSDWTVTEHGTPVGTLTYHDSDERYFVFKADRNQGFFNHLPCSKSLSQELSFSGSLPELKLRMRAKCGWLDYVGIVVLVSIQTDSDRVYYLSDNNWTEDSPVSEDRMSASYMFIIDRELDEDLNVKWQNIDLTIPPVSEIWEARKLKVEFWQYTATSQRQGDPVSLGAVEAMISHCSLCPSNSIEKGWQDTVTIANGARNSGGDYEIAGGRITTVIEDLGSMVQGVFINDGDIVKKIRDDNRSVSDNWLSFMAKDYALSVAVPRLITSGVVNIPSVPPMMFLVGSYKAWVETFEWDIYNSELSIELRSLPAVEMEVESEDITEIAESGSGGSSSSGGGGTGGGGTNNYEKLINLPKVNNVELKGNKSASDLGLATAAQGAKADTALQEETEPAFNASAAKNITSSNINNWNGKQDALVSGTNIKTINNQSLLGEGNISIGGDSALWEGGTGTGSVELKDGNNDAKGSRSAAIGQYLETNNADEVALGRYNVSTPRTSGGNPQKGTIFSIGVRGGSALNPSRGNALEVTEKPIGGSMATGLYLPGIGGYDGTNASESGVKSVQEVINGKGVRLDVDTFVNNNDELYLVVPSNVTLSRVSVEIGRNLTIKAGSKVRSGNYPPYANAWYSHKGWSKIGRPYSINASLAATTTDLKLPDRKAYQVLVDGDKETQQSYEAFESVYEMAQTFAVSDNETTSRGNGIRHGARRVQRAKWGVRLKLNGEYITPWLSFHICYDKETGAAVLSK